MRLVKVHNPSGLGAVTGRKKVATRRKRRTTKRRAVRRVVASNPKRRRHRRRRTTSLARVSNPVRRHRRRRSVALSNPRRRHHRRRHNPSGMGIGKMLKDIIYGTGGAILARTGSGLLIGFVPGGLGSSPLADPILQAALSATAIKWLGRKFLGGAQADIMMLGGFISAGLAAANVLLPNIQGQLTSIIRAPVAVAPVAPGATAMSDVYDVNMVDSGFGGLLNGFGDVEDVDVNMFGSY